MAGSATCHTLKPSPALRAGARADEVHITFQCEFPPAASNYNWLLRARIAMAAITGAPMFCRRCHEFETVVIVRTEPLCR